MRLGFFGSGGARRAGVVSCQAGTWHVGAESAPVDECPFRAVAAASVHGLGVFCGIWIVGGEGVEINWETILSDEIYLFGASVAGRGRRVSCTLNDIPILE